METWRSNPYNVRHFIEAQHKKTQHKIDKVRLELLGISEQLTELQLQQERTDKIIRVTSQVLITCAIVAVAIYLSN